jgi:Tfp pilus assembly protein FimT
MMMKPPSSTLGSRRLAGLTLVEILVGLGVLAILIAVAVPSMSDLLERRRVIAAAEELVSLLNYAKAETNSLDKQLAVHTEADPNNRMSCVAVTTSGGFDSRCKCYNPVDNMCPNSALRGLRAFQLPLDYVRFSAHANWSDPHVTDQIFLSREHNEPLGASGYYFEVVGQKRGYTLQVQMNAAGRVKLCAPNGDFSGYPRCT